ncbi:MAG: HU family DNA-binding protein [Bacteroidales bacterium]|nr:HU family DNA-binding protein [Bacteroidales bacterium]
MNRTDLINAIAEKAGVSKVAAKEALTACIESIREELNKGEKVSLVGFGTFSVVERKARTARNPQTGKSVKVAAKKVAKFKPSAALIAQKKGKKK